jgi:predicted transcriptional regulator
MGRRKTIEGEAVVVSVAMPKELRDRLKEIAYGQQTDFPDLLREVLRKFVERAEKVASRRAS